MAGTILCYNAYWDDDLSAVDIEMACIQNGGEWIGPEGQIVGKGLLHHYRALQDLLWPDAAWHRWRELLLQHFVSQRIVGVIGPASSGKTHDAGMFALTTYYCFPDETTVLCSSTEREMLEMRVWGEIKKHHRQAKSRVPWLPGYLIESRQRIVTDAKNMEIEGRDFRNGLCGVPCKKGGNYVGLGSYVGVKNKRLILVADEGQFMPTAYLDAISNLNKNPGFKGIILGNPKSTTDALGRVCEPAHHLGGWTSGIDQDGKTKTWETRMPEATCIQLVGSDSPNFDVPDGQPEPFPFLIGRKAIQADIQFYGKDSLQFTMMDEGRMPRGEGARRVITRHMCEHFNGFKKLSWQGQDVVRVGFLDAAYGSTGGDRTVFGTLSFGTDVDGFTRLMLDWIKVVPVSVKLDTLPEDQIALWVKDKCEEFGIAADHMFFDSTGRGTLMAAFARNWSAYVKPIEFGGPPTRRPVDASLYVEDKGQRRLKTCREHFSKFVSELWFSVRYAIEADRVRGLTEDLVQEGCMREWTMVAGHKIEVETKDKTRQRMGRSPDLFDAFVCGFEGARQLGFVVSRQKPKQEPLDQSLWFESLHERNRKLRRAYTLAATE